MWKMPFQEENSFSKVTFSDKFQFGTNIVVLGKKFFCFQRECGIKKFQIYNDSEQMWHLVSGFFEDFGKCCELSNSFLNKTEYFTLIALPNYPQFKCVSGLKEKQINPFTPSVP